MFSDTLELLVLLGIAVATSSLAHSRSKRYLPTSLLAGVLSTVAWFAFVLARHHAPIFLLRAILRADPLIVISLIVAAGCAVLIALVVGLFFRGKVALAAVLLVMLLILLVKACAPSGGPVDPL